MSRSSGSNGLTNQLLLILAFPLLVSADFLITFHGGGGGINNIHRYYDTLSSHTDAKLLPNVPDRDELRGFVFHSNNSSGKETDLYVCSANYVFSDILQYSYNSTMSAWNSVGDGHFTSDETVNSILHPYDIVFDDQGNAYISSQDSNLVTKVDANGVAAGVAPYLTETYPDATFLDGTWVASAQGNLPGLSATVAPPNVTAPQGLTVSLDSNGDVANSVRGLAIYQSLLFVSDEPGSAVKVYDLSTGELKAIIEDDGNVVAEPVQLLVHDDVLYIGCKGSDSIAIVNLTSINPDELSGEVIAPVVYVDGLISKPSGMTFDDQGNFYVAERTQRRIYTFDANGQNKTRVGEHKLHDDVEFIHWVPAIDEMTPTSAPTSGGSSNAEDIVDPPATSSIADSSSTAAKAVAFIFFLQRLAVLFC